MIAASTEPSTSASSAAPAASTRSNPRKIIMPITSKVTRNQNQVRSRLLNNLGIFNAPNAAAPNPAIERKMKIIRAMGLGGVIPPKPQTSENVGVLDENKIRAKIDFNNITKEPLKFKEIEIGTSKTSSGTNSNHSSRASSPLMDGGDHAINTHLQVSPEQVSQSLSGTSTAIGAVAGSSPSSNASSMQSKTSFRKRITFNNDVCVAQIPMRNEYSDRVRSRLWSNRFEIHENATRNAIEFQAEGWDWRSVVEDEGMFVCTSSGELIHPVHCQQ